ncbi:MAG: phosphate--acyl-ACP acyltransferase, partial [Clostridia bacterium]|nr:phosphate--acyl-ACP acyltransferase [Clostridia bacterium]
PQLRQMKKKLDYTEEGGAVLLGISKPVIKAHGSSNAKAFKNAIRQAANFARSGAVETITEQLQAQKEAEQAGK